MSIDYEIDYKAEVLKVYPHAYITDNDGMDESPKYHWVTDGCGRRISDTYRRRKKEIMYKNAFERLQQHSQTK